MSESLPLDLRAVYALENIAAELTGIREYLESIDLEPFITNPERQRIFDTINSIMEDANAIYVRESVDGVWDSYSLIELPAHLAILHACRLIQKAIKKGAAKAPEMKG